MEVQRQYLIAALLKIASTSQKVLLYENDEARQWSFDECSDGWMRFLSQYFRPSKSLWILQYVSELLF